LNKKLNELTDYDIVKMISNEFKYLKPASVDVIVYNIERPLSIIAVEFIAVLRVQTNEGQWLTTNLGKFTAYINENRVEIRKR